MGNNQKKILNSLITMLEISVEANWYASMCLVATNGALCNEVDCDVCPFNENQSTEETVKLLKELRKKIEED